MRSLAVVSSLALALTIGSVAARGDDGVPAGAPVVVPAAHFAVSPAVRTLAAAPSGASPILRKAGVVREQPLGRLPRPAKRAGVERGVADPVVQRHAPALLMPGPLSTFEGVGNLDSVYPSDCNGDVGFDHYVEMVNLHMCIYDKATGTNVVAPFLMSSLYAAAGFPGPASSSDDGDPVVLYDHLANRWLISQFIVSVSPCHEVIAISQTPDPTGAWYLYDFVMPNTKMNDYPHLGVWPDGYYMTDNQFSVPGFAWAGAGVFVFDRGRMIAGDASASYQYFDLAGIDLDYGGLLPADLDGPLPPSGTPCYFAMIDDSIVNGFDAMYIWEFHVDWTNTANTTFGHGGQPNYTNAVAPFDSTFSGGRNNVPQPDTAQKLDAIADRLMHRLQYRNFGSYESLVACHTVDVDTDHAGVRYYQFRRDLPAGVFDIDEQATFAPDAAHRWMGSAAMDGQGNLAVGYSCSSTNIYPSVRYAGRVATDPTGGLFQGEATLYAGNGSQTGSAARWGDYSMLAVDPVDDTTFWYVNEYLPVTSVVGWHTRIGSFRLGALVIGTLKGVVTNALTGEPIGGASVGTTNGLGTITSPDGSYVRHLGTGDYDVVAAADFFYPSAPVPVTIVQDATTLQNFGLSPMPLRVFPTAGFSVSGQEGGPFAPPSVTYVLTNAALSSLVWTARTGQAWLMLSSEGGTLDPGSATSVTVTVNHEADFLGVGAYADTIVFSNTTASETFSRPAVLTVAAYKPPAFACFDFASGQPAGWTVLTNDAQNALSAWRFDDPGNRGNRTGGGGIFAIVDDDRAGFGTNTDTELRSGVFDLSGFVEVFLSFKTDYRDYRGEFADVDISRDGAAGPWSNVWRSTGVDFPGPTTLYLDVSDAAAGASNAVVRFHYYDDGNWGWWWEVDDVCLAGAIAQDSGGLDVRPKPGLLASGFHGGPFAPDRIYQLTNSSPGSIDWTTAAATTWVACDPPGGTLAPGEVQAVTVAVNAAATTLAPGVHVSSIAFSNVTEGVSQSRDVSLTVVDTLQVSPSAGYSASGLEGGPFTPGERVYALTNPSSHGLTWTAAWTQVWASVAPVSGALAPGEMQAVTVTPVDALLTAPGVYADAIAISNEITGAFYTRPVTVTVIEITGEIEIEDSVAPTNDLDVPFGAVNIASPVTEHVTVHNVHGTRNLVVDDILFGQYFEDFNDGLAEDWFEDVDSNWEVIGGEYRAQTSAEDFMTAVYTGRTWAAASVRAVLRRTGDGYNSHGVVLRASPNLDVAQVGSGYLFLISGNSYSVFWVDGTSVGALQGWSFSSAILTNAPNVLKATASDTQLWLQVNGSLVWQGGDSRFASGHVGLCGYSTPVSPTTHYFDDVVVDLPVAPTLGLGGKQRYFNGQPQPGSTPQGAVPPAHAKSPGKSTLPSPSVMLAQQATNFGPFSLGNLPTFPATIPPGGSFTFDVAYAPLQVGTNTASISINNNDNDEPIVTVNLSGHAAAGAMTGRVMSANSGLPLPGADVSAFQDATLAASDATDSEGAFLVALQLGTYDVRATAANYTTALVSGIDLPYDGAVTGLAFTLTGSELHYGPASLAADVDYGVAITNTVALTNTGPLTLYYSAALTSSAPWAVLVNPTGAIAPGATATLDVVFDTTAIPNEPVTNTSALAFAGTMVNEPPLLPLTLGIVPDDLLIRPTTGLAFRGVEGGPYSPDALVYTLTNAGGGTVTWVVADDAFWMDIAPASGTLPAGEAQDITARLNGVAAVLPVGLHGASLTFTNLASDIRQTRAIDLVAAPATPDFLTELFSDDDVDLANSMLTFTPFPGFPFYLTCRSNSVTAFPSDPVGGTPLPLSDDSYAQVSLANAVPFFGQPRSNLFVGSNGYVTFGGGDYNFLEDIDDHFAFARVAALFVDLNPDEGGTISWKEFPDRVAVTWQDVPEFGIPGPNDIQVELFTNGVIRVTWLDLAVVHGLAGLSQGTGTPPAFVESDLSAYSACDVLPPPVAFSPEAPSDCDELIVTYDATGRTLSNASPVYATLSFDDWATWSHHAMSPIGGDGWLYVGAIPPGASSASVNFRNASNDVASVVDDNDGNDWVVAIAPCLGLVITNPPEVMSVAFAVTQSPVEGYCNTGLFSGALTWTNALTGSTGATPVARSWSVAGGVPLGVGTNVVTVCAASAGTSVVMAADSATNAAYDDGWTGGDNGGFGWGAGWSMDVSGSAGFFIASNDLSNLSAGPRAWGLWANSGGLVAAVRPFAFPLAVGQTLSLRFDNNWIDTGFTVGMGLQNGLGDNLFEFLFVGGAATYVINDSITTRPTGIPWTGDGLDLTFRLTGSTQYVFTCRATVITGNLASSASASATRFRTWNYSAGAGWEHNLYINNLRLAVPAASESATAVVVRLAVGAVGDTDHDGMDDAWEIDHGLQVGVQDAFGNPDGDAWLNWQEFVADANPNASNATLSVRIVQDPAGLAVLAGPATTNSRRYDLQINTNLVWPGPWEVLQSNVTGAEDGGSLTLILTNAMDDSAVRVNVHLP